MELSFQGSLNKFAPVGGEGKAVQLAIRTVPKEPRDLIKELSWNDFTRPFSDPILWEKLVLTIEKDVKLSFDALSFSAELLNISFKKKISDEGVSFITTFNFQKFLDPNVDHVLNANYLKHKEPDPENGKMKIVDFGVSIVK